MNILDWLYEESERTRHEKSRSCTNSCVTEVTYYVLNSYVLFSYSRKTFELPLSAAELMFNTAAFYWGLKISLSATQPRSIGVQFLTKCNAASVHWDSIFD